MWIQKVPGGGVDALAYAPDGRTLYTRDGARWVTAWDVQTRTGTRLFQAGGEHYATPPGLALADRGRFLVAVGRPTFVHDAAHGTRQIEPRDLTDEYILERVVRPDPTAPRLLALRAGGVIGSWDLDAWGPGPDVARWPDKTDFLLRFDLGSHGQALLRNRNALAELTLFDAAAGGFAARFVVNVPAPYFEPFPAPDGRTAVLYAFQTAYLWDRDAGAVRGGPVPVSYPSPALAFHPTARVFSALNRDRVFTLYSLDTGEPIRSLDFALGRRVRCAAFAPDGLTCAVGGSNKQFAVFDLDF